MRHPEYRYADVAFGGVDKRNDLRNVAGLKAPDGVADCYRSVYRYPEAMKEQFNKTRSVGGYSGAVYADWLPIDIDDEDVTKAHVAAKRLLQQLEVRYDVDLGAVLCFFSGAKGFHVLLPDVMFGWEPGPDLPRRMRQAALALADGVPIDTTIYDRVRLFRMSNTKHGKSGLYKVPLVAREVLHQPTNVLLAVARAPRSDVMFAEASPNEALHALWSATLREPKASPPAVLPGKPDKWAKPCVARMLQGVTAGQRNAVALRLAVHFRKQGLPGAMILAALREWNKSNAEALDESELEAVTEKAVANQYDYGCNDGLMQEYCGGRCPFRKEMTDEGNNSSVVVADIAEAQKRYEEYVAVLRTGRVTLGLGPLDDAMRGIAPGETCWIMARTSVGKTAFLINILANNSEAGVDSLFCTLEQPTAQIYERGVQLANETTGRDVEQVFLKTLAAIDLDAPLPPEYAKWTRAVREKMALVRFADADSMGFDEIAAAVEAYEKRFGAKPRILAIDYLGRMNGGPGTPYEQVSRLAKQVKSLAKKLKIAVLVLHQVSREGGDGSQEISLDMGRDSGQVEESADFVIGLWRPEMKQAIQERRAVEPIKAALLKCRKGPLTQTTFLFDKAHMRFGKA